MAKGNEQLVVALAPKPAICQTILLSEIACRLEEACLRNLGKLGEGVLALPKLLPPTPICARDAIADASIFVTGLAMVACVVKCDEHAIALASSVMEVNVSKMVS